MKSMAEFGRITKNPEEIIALSRTAVMASNVTSMTADVAAKSLSSAMISFKINAKDSMKVLDQWNELQNNFRVSAEDLAGSIGVVGSAAKQAGVSIQELEGYTTAIVSATGVTGDEAGTALKSMLSRIYRLGPEGEEDAGKAEALLNSVGIAVRASATSFRDMGDILTDVKDKWSTMNDAQKMSIAQQIGGTHHYSKFIALMDNYQISIDATTMALNSQGSAVEENAKYVNSIEGKLAILNTTFQELANNLLSSTAFKVVIDLLTVLLGLLSQGVVQLGLFVGAMYMLVKAIITSETALKALSVFMTTNALGLAIMGIALAIGLVVLAVDKFLPNAEKLSTELKQIEDSVKSMESELSKAKSAFEILKDATSSTEDLAKARETLNKTLGDSVVKSYDAEGKAISINNEQVRIAIGLKEKELQAEKDLQKIKSKQTVDALKQEYYNTLWDIDYTTKANGQDFIGGLFNNYEQQTAESKLKLAKTLSELNRLQKDYGFVLDENIQKEIDASAVTEDTTKAVEEKKAAYIALEAKTGEYIDSLKELESSYETLSDGEKLSSDSLDDLIMKYPTVATYIANTNDLSLNKGEILKKVAEIQKQAMIDELKQKAAIAQATIDEAQTFIEQTQAKMSALLGLATAQQAYANGLGTDEFYYPTLDAEGNSLTEKQIAGLEAENEFLNKNEEIVNKLNQKKIDLEASKKSIETINAQIIALSKTKFGEFGGTKKAKAEKAEASKVSDYIKEDTEKFKEQDVVVDSLNRKIEKYNILINTEDITTKEGLEKRIALINEQNDLYKEQQIAYHELAEANRKELAETSKKLKDFGLDPTSAFELGDIGQVMEYNAKEYADYLKKVENEKNSLMDQRVALNGKLQKSSGTQATDIENQIKLLDKLISNMQLYGDNIIKARDNWGENEAEINANLEKIKDLREDFRKAEADAKEKADKEAADAAKKLEEEQQKLVDKYFNYIKDKMDKRKEALEIEKKGIEDFYDAEIEKIKEAEDERKKQIDTQKIINELNEKELEIQKAKLELDNIMNEKNTRILQKDVNGEYFWNYEANPQKVKEAQENIAKLETEKTDIKKKQTEQELNDLADEKIKKLEIEKKASQDLYDKKVEGINNYLKELDNQKQKEEGNLLSYTELVSKLDKEWKKANASKMAYLQANEIAAEDVLEKTKTPKDMINDVIGGIANVGKSIISKVTSIISPKNPNDIIAEAKKEWETASASGNKKAMEDAHVKAEAARASMGFSGAAGNEHIEIKHDGIDSGFVGGLKSNEQMTKLLKGELVLNQQDLRNILPNFGQVLKKSTEKTMITTDSGITINNLTVISNNADNFASQLRNISKTAKK
jgi:TP901 family phage tail tape measure protein